MTKTYSLFLISFILHLSYCEPPKDLCINGCQLLYRTEFIDCANNQAFVPNSYLSLTANDNNNDGNLDIDIINLIQTHSYICFAPNYQRLEGATYTQDGDTSVFNLDSPVLIWQAIIISIVVPLMALLLFKVVLVLCNKCCELKICQNNDKCCCCLTLCSAKYRQKKRNRKFPYNNPNDDIHELDLDIHHNNIANNNNNNNKWWKFNRKNSQKNNNNNLQNENVEPIMLQNGNGNGEDGIDLVLDDNINNNHGEDMDIGKNINVNNINEYEHLPLNENDDKAPRNVLEEVSVDHNEMEKYLQAPGGNNQDIELSFSSQGLRQISYRDVV